MAVPKFHPKSTKSGAVGISAFKVGAWTKARRRVKNLSTTYPEIEAIVAAQAYRSSQRIKRNIRTQVYDWEKLADATVANKRSRGHDPRILIATEQYVNSIRVMSQGPGAWAIGIPGSAKNDKGVSLAKIGLWHEFGAGNMPPRPHWRREYGVFAGQVTASVNAWLKTKD